MDWKQIVGGVAPALATALGGPLAGAAAAVLAKKLTGSASQDPAVNEQTVADMLTGPMTPELRAKIIDAETALKTEAMRMGLEEKRIDADTDKAFLADVADARKTHGTEPDLIWLAVAVLTGWLVITAGTLIGLFLMLTGGIEIKDVGIVATVFTVLGSTVGYVSNSAQQVLSYFYGSSRGSLAKTRELAQAISGARK